MPHYRRRPPKLWNASSDGKNVIFQGSKKKHPMKMSCYCGKTRKRPNFGIHFLDAFDERNSRFTTAPYSLKKTCFYEHRPRSAGMFLMSYFSDLAEQGPTPENIPCLKNRRCGFAFKIVKPSKTVKDQWKPWLRESLQYMSPWMPLDI